MEDSILYGAIGGAAATFGLWFIVSRVIDNQLAAGADEMVPAIQQAVRTEVPPAVHAELTRTLAEYGITPATGAQVNQLLTTAERLRVI